MPTDSSPISSPVAEPTDAAADPIEDSPPILGSWRNLYLLLVGELFVLAALFWLLTEWAS